MSTPSTDVLVIGAGIAGLVCAGELTRAGLEVQVVDAAGGIGGRMRTDRIDGYRCDRGFQLLNPAYPAAKTLLDLPALELCRFGAGVGLLSQGREQVLADPVRAPGRLPATLRSGYLRPGELVRLTRWAAPALGPVGRLETARDVSLTESLDAAGVHGPLRLGVLEPFLTGVLADDSGATSAAFVRLLVRSFLRGSPGVPAHGMGAIPAQLAAQLRHPVRTRLAVGRLRTGSGVEADILDGVLHARTAVVATDPVTAAGLTGVDRPTMKGLSTYWFATETAPTSLDLVLLDGRGPQAGPVVNAAVMSAVAPTYAPAGRHLVQATTLLRSGNRPGAEQEVAVRRQLAGMFGVDIAGWQLVTAHHVPAALPVQPPPLRPRAPVDLGDGMFVAGDHRDTASIQGAMVSGRRAARAVARHLGLPAGRPAG